MNTRHPRVGWVVWVVVVPKKTTGPRATLIRAKYRGEGS